MHCCTSSDQAILYVWHVWLATPSHIICWFWQWPYTPFKNHHLKLTSACSVISRRSRVSAGRLATIPDPIKIVVFAILHPAAVAQLKVASDVGAKETGVGIVGHYCGEKGQKVYRNNNEIVKTLGPVNFLSFDKGGIRNIHKYSGLWPDNWFINKDSARSYIIIWGDSRLHCQFEWTRSLIEMKYLKWVKSHLFSLDLS